MPKKFKNIINSNTEGLTTNLTNQKSTKINWIQLFFGNKNSYALSDEAHT